MPRRWTIDAVRLCQWASFDPDHVWEYRARINDAYTFVVAITTEFARRLSFYSIIERGGA